MVDRLTDATVKAKKTINFLLRLWFGNIWISRTVALIALVNLTFVLLDLSYVPWRDFWLLGKVRVFSVRLGWFKYEGINLQVLPSPLSRTITENYDPIKGIEPHTETVDYLATVSQLQANINRLNSPDVAEILAKLRQDSVEMIQNNPFELANKTGHLERIKNLMRSYVGQKSAKESFKIFWSPEYLQQNTLEKMSFFDNNIKPLIESNYYRRIDENGKFIDYFYLIDFPFFVLFLLDFLGRTLYITQLYPGLKWREAMLWRWYDVFLFISFFRILRVIPVIIRLDQTELINLQIIETQVTQGFVSSIAKEMTEVVILRVFTHIEQSIENGDILKIMLSTDSKHEYIDLNQKDEVREIFTILLQFGLKKVVPQIRPDLQVLLEYLIQKSLKDTSFLRFLPRFEALQKQAIAKSIDSILTVCLKTFEQVLEEDAIFDQHLEKLKTSLFKSLSKFQTDESLPELKHLVRELIKEIKFNYTKSIQPEEMQQILLKRNDIVNQETNQEKYHE